MSNPARCLFIVKRKESYGENTGMVDLKNGLFNSANFVVDFLNANHIAAKIVQVHDNNDIDREVSAFNPTHVFVEAMWVVPAKFDELTKLHPLVKWIVRIHSELPFMATEGIVIDWIRSYLIDHNNVSIAFNSDRAYSDIGKYFSSFNAMETDVFDRILYLPNCYPTDFQRPKTTVPGGYLNVGCFGAIRPFKNHLIQAVAAIEYARLQNKHLSFYVNGTRLEQDGGEALKNLKALFRDHPRAKLVLCDWVEREPFLQRLALMDVSLQGSFTETFNIVSADATFVGLPIVVSEEIRWASRFAHADITSVDSMVSAMDRVISYSGFITAQNQRKLSRFLGTFGSKWLEYLA